MTDVQTGYADVDRLMKIARRIEREGKKETAELIYTAASEIARMRSDLRPCFDVLLQHQEPLGAPFSRVLADNMSKLYER